MGWTLKFEDEVSTYLKYLIDRISIIIVKILF